MMAKNQSARWLSSQPRAVRIAIDTATILCVLAALFGALTAEAAHSEDVFSEIRVADMHCH